MGIFSLTLAPYPASFFSPIAANLKKNRDNSTIRPVEGINLFNNAPKKDQPLERRSTIYRAEQRFAREIPATGLVTGYDQNGQAIVDESERGGRLRSVG